MKSVIESTTVIILLTIFSLALVGCGDDTGLITDGDESETEAETETPDGDADYDAESEETEALEDDLELELEEELEEELEPEIEYQVGLPPRPDFAPSLMLLPEDKDRILARLDKEPFISILAKIRSSAERSHYDLTTPNVFDSDEQKNGVIAQHAAFLAWLENDTAMADKARDFLQQLSGDYHSHEDGDINIRLPSIVICYANALDFLVAGNFIPEDEIEDAEDKLTFITSEFYKEYVLDDLGRLVSIALTQNNHPIRTACSIGYIAMAYPEHPDAEAMANWAFSELDYLYGPNGQYVQPDGGVSEGPHYYRFGFGAAQAVFLAYRNRIGEPLLLKRDCINRQDIDPWQDHGCIDGEPFVYENLLYGERVQKSVEWMFSLRMPNGRRPPLEDGGMKDQNGSGLFAGIMDRPDLLWDYYNNNFNMGGGMDLYVQHLAYVPDDMEPVEPDWKNKVMYDAGQAIFRSGWDTNAVWALVNAEHGSVRKTVHDHVDGGSFQLYAYGEYLLMDTGYYKPVAFNNARTAQADAHNVLIIDGEEVPEKGILTTFGDTDAFLENEYLSNELSYVESRQPLEISTTERSVMMVHGRYLVTADRIVTTNTTPRLHTWRLHGYAGYDEGEDFKVNANNAVWQREAAGVEVYLSSTDDGLTLAEPPFKEWYPPHVHEIDGDEKHHGVMDGTITAAVPGFLSVSAPYSTSAVEGDAEYKLEVTPLTFNNGETGVTAYSIKHSEGEEIALLRKPDAVTTITLSTGDTIETDAEFVLVSKSGSNKVALIARGTMMQLNSVSIFENETGTTAVKQDF